MKKILLSAIVLSGLVAVSCDNAASKIKSGETASTSTENNASANAQSNNAMETQVNTNGALPVFSFNEENHDFGTIEEGVIAKHDFEFTNTGDAPLIITNASGSCGCTVPSWPREPIAPGETGKIHVEFNSNGRTGNQTKTVTLSSNTVPNKKVLRISAQVNPDPNKAAEQQNG
tara:strand:- start:16709 stop:17230 length:522 start_codon:yes stop_codon:yes gene_type:complete